MGIIANIHSKRLSGETQREWDPELVPTEVEVTDDKEAIITENLESPERCHELRGGGRIEDSGTKRKETRRHICLVSAVLTSFHLQLALMTAECLLSYL